MQIQIFRRRNIYPILPTRIVAPPGPASMTFTPITKRYEFRPFRAAGARQPTVEGRLAMRQAAMTDNRYCCGDVNGR